MSVAFAKLPAVTQLGTESDREVNRAGARWLKRKRGLHTLIIPDEVVAPQSLTVALGPSDDVITVSVAEDILRRFNGILHARERVLRQSSH